MKTREKAHPEMGSRRMAQMVLVVAAFVALGCLELATAPGARAAGFAATASVKSHVHFLNDSVGKVFKFTVKNTGTQRSIGAVSIRRPSKHWTVTKCPEGPHKWLRTKTKSSCTYKSKATAADDIGPGQSFSGFMLKATTGGGSTDRTGNWKVLVSRTNSFSPATKLAATPAPAGLHITSHVWKVTGATLVDGPVASDTPCPPLDKVGFAGTDVTLVVCGRNRADVALTPTEAETTLAGTFIGSTSGLTTDVVAAKSTSNVVLANWGVTLTDDVGIGKTVVARVGSASDQTSPNRRLKGYQASAIPDPPLAEDDGYQAAGNIPISFGAEGGVLVNDAPNGAELTFDDSATAGDVSVEPDGGFTFEPAAGFSGTDSFTYTLTGPAGSDTATVFIDVSGPTVWFIDNEAAPGDGRLSSPFNSTGAFMAIQNGPGDNDAEPGDVIFVFEGNGPYNGGLQLLNNQRLIGQGVDLVLDDLPPGSVPLPTATSAPTLANSGGPGIELGTGNDIRGLRVGNSSGPAIVGTDFESLVVRNVSIDTTGALLSLSGGLLNAEFSSLTSTGSAGPVLSISNALGTFTAGGHTSITGATGDAVVLSNNGGATMTFGTLTVTTSAGRGLVATGGGLMQVVGSNSSIDATGGAALVLDGMVVSSTFAQLTSTDSPASGLQLNGVQGALMLGTTTITGADATAMDLDGVDATVDINPFGVVTIAGRDAQGIDIDGGSGAISLGDVVAHDPNNVAGDAVVVRNRSGATTLRSLDADNAGDSGLFLSANSGAVSVNGGDITGAAGPAVDVAGGNGNVTFAGTINAASPGRSVRVQNRNGGIATFSGAIGDTGGGVSVAGNTGATIRFTGGMTVSTGTNPAFAATGGGTLGVTGVNTLTTTTAVALRMENVSFQPTTGVTFRSVSAMGAPSGIVVGNTGNSGSFVISGTGAGGSGGSIVGATGDAVSLSNTSADLRTVNITSPAGDGIDAAGVANLDVSNSIISGTGGHGINGFGVTSFDLVGSQILNAGNADEEQALNFTNLTGTSNIQTSTIDNPENDGLRITNSNTNLTLNVTNNTFQNVNGPFGNDAILVQPNGNSAITVDVSGTTFTNVLGNSLQVSASTVGSNGTSTVRFTQNTVNQTAANQGGGFFVSGQESTITNLNVSGNGFTNVGGNGLVTTDANDSSTIKGTLANNTITNPPGPAMVIAGDESSVTRLVINANQIAGSGGDGIQVANFSGVGTSTMNAIITNNVVNGHSDSADPNVPFIGGIAVFSFEDTTCIKVTGNTVTNTPGGFENIYLQRDTGTMTLEEVPNTAATGTATPGYITSTNSVPSASVVGTVTLSDGVACVGP